MDSGATDHVSASLTHFRSYNQLNPPIMVKLPNGHYVPATHSGDICLSASIILSDVLYIPSFTFNLISISKLVSSTNCKLIFFSTSCILQDTNTQARIGTVEVRNGLYHLTPNHITTPTVQTAITHPQCIITPIDLWHFRMGHLSFERLQHMQSSYPFLKHNKNFVCNTCHYAKHKKLPFPSSNSYASCCFDLLRIDIWGPCLKLSMHGHRYFLTIVDDHSRFTWIFLMHTKAEARKNIIDFTAYVETQFSGKIKTIRTDNGFEFSMHDFYALKGIIHQTSCVKTPKQNGIVERKHQHLLNVTRALLFQANLPHSFWCFALIHVAYLINCIPTPFLQNISPYEKLYGNSCDISNL